MSRLFRWTFHDTIYGPDVEILIGPIEDLKRYIVRRYGAEAIARVTFSQRSLGKCLRHCDERGVDSWSVWFPGIAREPKAHECCTYVHEAIHLGAQILRSRGIELRRASEEAFTYYIDELYLQIIKALQRYVKHRHGPRRRRRRKRTSR